MNNDNMTREALHQDFMNDPTPYLEEAKERQVDLDVLLNRKSNEPVSGYPEDALSDILAREDLSITASRSSGSATVADFDKTEAGKVIFWNILDRDYEAGLGLDELATRDLNTIGGGPSNSSFNPSATRPLTERNRFSPKITIGDIAAGVETIPGTEFKQPEYTTTIEGERTRDIPEGGVIPTTTLSYAEIPGKTKKFGGGLRFSDEFQLSDINMGLLRMWARRMAMRDEIKIVNEGLEAALRAAGTTADVTLGSGDFDFDDILRLSFFDGGSNSTTNPNENNGYQLMSLFAVESVAMRIAKAYGSTGNPGVLSQYPQGAFGNLINAIELINGLGGPTRLGLVRDNSVVVTAGTLELNANTILGVDTRFALILQRQARGITSEDMRIAKQQITERYTTQRLGWMASDPDACFHVGA